MVLARYLPGIADGCRVALHKDHDRWQDYDILHEL